MTPCPPPAFCPWKNFSQRIDYSLPGSSVHGILQPSILEWVSMPSSRGSGIPGPGIEPACLVSPALQAGSLPTEPPGKPLYHCATSKIKSPELHLQDHYRRDSIKDLANILRSLGSQNVELQVLGISENVKIGHFNLKQNKIL